ncbi:M28 family peptidase [Candidatus Dojkabacteria bacterium]|nr:M28 family peptidase [Candidatus Dojkabacteria bacterium]
MKSQKEYLEIIQSLPHRGVGTTNEKRAAGLLRKEFMEMGFEPKIQGFKIFKYNWIAYLVEFSLFGFSGVALLVGADILSIIFLLFGCSSFFGFPIEWDDAFYKHLFPGTSQNISIEIAPETKVQKTLVINAHYDTGKVILGAQIFGRIFDTLLGRKAAMNSSVFKIRFLPKIFQTPAFLTDSIIVAQIIALVLAYLGYDLYLFFAIYGTFWSFAHTIFVTHVIVSPFVPGALDNGSSVVVGLRLAEYFKDKPLEYTRLVILNDGAEEIRLAGKGVESFYKDMEYDRDSTYFLNLECLGSKNIVFTEGESDNRNGIHMNDAKSFRFLRSFVENSRYKDSSKFTYLPICSDASALEREGAKVISTMLSMEDNGIDGEYHTMNDVAENLNFSTMEKAEEMLKDFVVEFDRNFSVGKQPFS